MKNQINSFYLSLSKDYHLIYNDWNSSIKRQADLLDLNVKFECKLMPY